MKTPRFAPWWAAAALLFALAAPHAAAQDITVTAANPAVAEQGVTLDVEISGSGFKKGARAAFLVTGTTNPGGVVVNSTAFVNSNKLIANITVAPDAQTELKYDITVTAAGRTGKGIELFGVLKANQCEDTPMQVIFAPAIGTDRTHRIFGDGAAGRIYNNPADAAFDGGTIYTDGVDGVYVRFQLCNATNDLIIKALQTKRYMNFDFSDWLTAPDSEAVDVRGQVRQEQFFNINQAANETLYVNGQFRTCMGTSLMKIIRGQTAHVFFREPALYETAPGGVPDCHDGALADLANRDGATSQVLVNRVDSCTWTIEPTVDTTGAHRGTLVEQLKGGSYASGGQFNMPFRIKAKKLSCP